MGMRGTNHNCIGRYAYFGLKAPADAPNTIGTQRDEIQRHQRTGFSGAGKDESLGPQRIANSRGGTASLPIAAHRNTERRRYSRRGASRIEFSHCAANPLAKPPTAYLRDRH